MILNRVVYPAIALAFLVPAFVSGYELISAVIGGAVGAGILLPLALLFPRGMGMGDVKLAALIGLLVGFPQVLIALLSTSILGGVVAGGLLLVKLKGRKDPIPFAPFLIAGLVVTMLYYDEILGLLYLVRW